MSPTTRYSARAPERMAHRNWVDHPSKWITIGVIVSKPGFVRRSVC